MSFEIDSGPTRVKPWENPGADATPIDTTDAELRLEQGFTLEGGAAVTEALLEENRASASDRNSPDAQGEFTMQDAAKLIGMIASVVSVFFPPAGAILGLVAGIMGMFGGKG